jgi:hypothetical protein
MQIFFHIFMIGNFGFANMLYPNRLLVITSFVIKHVHLIILFYLFILCAQSNDILQVYVL